MGFITKIIRGHYYKPQQRQNPVIRLAFPSHFFSSENIESFRLKESKFLAMLINETIVFKQFPLNRFDKPVELLQDEILSGLYNMLVEDRIRLELNAKYTSESLSGDQIRKLIDETMTDEAERYADSFGFFEQENTTNKEIQDKIKSYFDQISKSIESLKTSKDNPITKREFKLVAIIDELMKKYYILIENQNRVISTALELKPQVNESFQAVKDVLKKELA